MFQINRKEYLNMIDALGGLQTVLETERETQQSMADSSEANFTGAAGSSLRLGIRIFLSYGVYERAYQQSKKMKESMESLLPLVNKLLGEADTLDQHLETDAATYAVTPFTVPYGQAGNEIFMLNEGYVNYLEQQCEDLVEKGKILKGQMQDAINKCSGIIDCSAEQTAINEAYQSVLRIENFKQAFRSYVIGVRDLDESLRLDFQTYTDAEVVESGKALQEVVNNEIEINMLKIVNIPSEWEKYYYNIKKLISEIDENKMDDRFNYDIYNIKEIYKDNKEIYEKISLCTGIPPELIAAIHYRESACDFDTYLHNGQQLGQPTTITPTNRVFSDFTEAAIDALLYVQESKGIELPSNPDMVFMMWFAEIYNGTGYSEKCKIASPYVFSGTNVYQKGKYVTDGNFDPDKIDAQPGIYILVMALREKEE